MEKMHCDACGIEIENTAEIFKVSIGEETYESCSEECCEIIPLWR